MEWFRSHEPELRNWQLEVAAIPAPPFGKGPRAEWLRACFCELGLQDVQLDAVGNVAGLRPPADPDQKLVAVTAHIDTVFAASTPLNVRREGDRLHGAGISDNGAGIVGLLASAVRSAKVRHSAGDSGSAYKHIPLVNQAILPRFWLMLVPGPQPGSPAPTPWSGRRQPAH